MKGHDDTIEVSDKLLHKQLKNINSFLLVTYKIKDCNFYVVTVSTSVNRHNNPYITPTHKSFRNGR